MSQEAKYSYLFNCGSIKSLVAPQNKSSKFSTTGGCQITGSDNCDGEIKSALRHLNFSTTASPQIMVF